MGSVTQAGGPADLSHLSDKQLIKRYCPTKKDRGAIEELWRRHSETAYGFAHRWSRSLCPPFYDREDLAGECFEKARDNFRNRICGFRKLDSARSFRVWLSSLVHSTTRDRVRVITQSRIKDKAKRVVHVSLGEVFERGAGKEASDEERTEAAAAMDSVELPIPPPFDGEPTVETDKFEDRTSHLWFRSRYSTNPLDPVAPADRKLFDEQRKFVFREILTRHAESSEENAHCTRIIRMRYVRRWPMQRISSHVYGPSATKRQEESRKRAIYRLLDKDYEGLRLQLAQVFRITAPEHI